MQLLARAPCTHAAPDTQHRLIDRTHNPQHSHTSRRHNAFVTELPERAAAQAADSDRRQRSSGSLGAVDGMIISVKDSYCIEVRTLCSLDVHAHCRLGVRCTTVQIALDA